MTTALLKCDTVKYFSNDCLIYGDFIHASREIAKSLVISYRIFCYNMRNYCRYDLRTYVVCSNIQ
jgi:hypothetical protein